MSRSLPLEAQVAGAYEQYLVPRLYEPWGRVLLEKLDLRQGETLVDVATGPGTLARLAAIRLGGKGRVIATDLSNEMLQMAQQRTGLPGVAPIEYLDCPAVPLPIPDGTATVVTCQQGLPYFPDRPAALAEMRRVAKPGARLGLLVWAEVAACNVAAAIHAGLKDGGPAPLAEVWKASYGAPGPKELEAMVNASGFYQVKVDRLTLPLVFEGGTDQVFASLWGTPLAEELSKLSERERLSLRDAIAKKLGPLTKAKVVEGKQVAVVLTARR